MRTILMSGAKRYEDLLRDWTTWTDLHRPKPDVILVDHTFAQELCMVTDPKRIQAGDGGGEDEHGPYLLFMGVQVLCFCALRDADPTAFDCPSEFDDSLRNDQDVDIQITEALKLPVGTSKKAIKKAIKKKR